MTNNYPFWVGVFLLGLLLTTCTEEELERSREAETRYVDLLYALTEGDEAAARTASNSLNHDLSLTRFRWYRPQGDEEVDNKYYHLAKAQSAYTQSRASINEGNLELAAVQLDRAVYELSAADPVAFNELYVASIYDFIATWLEVNRAVHDHDLCSLNWNEFSRYGKDARYAWRQVKWRQPSEQVYLYTPEEMADFKLAHFLLNNSIDHFIEVVSTGDQCAAQVAAKEVNESLWSLLRQFGSKHPADL